MSGIKGAAGLLTAFLKMPSQIFFGVTVGKQTFLGLVAATEQLAVMLPTAGSILPLQLNQGACPTLPLLYTHPDGFSSSSSTETMDALAYAAATTA
eukprot:scaffold39146_cov181-Skeletonema_marinoi.AAC.5